jgi:hypothetical protein
MRVGDEGRLQAGIEVMTVVVTARIIFEGVRLREGNSIQDALRKTNAELELQVAAVFELFDFWCDGDSVDVNVNAVRRQELDGSVVGFEEDAPVGS